MARKGYYLGGNKGTETPGNLIFVDTESYSNPVPGYRYKRELTLMLWTAIRVRIEKGKVTRRKVAQGETSEEFWQFVMDHSDRYRVTWIFGHNIGHDLTQLDFWRMLDDRRFTLAPSGRNNGIDRNGKPDTRTGKLVTDGPAVYICCFAQGKAFRMVDTGNYWRKPLSDIGEHTGRQKHKIPSPESSKDDWYKYCLRDTEIIERAIVDLLLQWSCENCGVFQLTAAMMALTNFKHICDIRTEDEKSPDIVCKPNAPEHILERESYYGGRNVCYFVGRVRGTIYHIDCNSLYPFVMSRNFFPRRFVRYKEGMTHDELRAAMRVYGVIAKVSLNARTETYPLRIDEKQYHCTGRYWTALCGPELQRAVDNESIHRVGTVQFYSVAPLFSKWVSYWYNRKLAAIRAGNDGLRELEFCKLILNSLSGKFAQHGRRWLDIPGRYPLKRWGGWVELNDKEGTYEKWRGIAGNSQRLCDGEEPKHSFPAISAFITSFGREYMRSIVSMLPEGSVYYMATDSLLIDSTAFGILAASGFVHPTKLGKFKLLGEYREAEILGSNWYKLDGKTVASGLWGKSISASQENGKVEQWERLAGVIADGPRKSVVITEMDATRPKADYRGHLTPEGFWVPYRLSMDPDFSDRPVLVSDLPEYSTDTMEGHTMPDVPTARFPSAYV